MARRSQRGRDPGAAEDRHEDQGEANGRDRGRAEEAPGRIPTARQPARRMGPLNADTRWMAAALALSARGRGRTAPNPNVGRVIVNPDRVVGRDRKSVVAGKSV